MTRFCVEVENVDNTSTADVAYLLPANDALFFFFSTFTSLWANSADDILIMYFS